MGPPGTGGTTLVEELEFAAEMLDHEAWKRGPDSGLGTDAKELASHYRARAARVRELERETLSGDTDAHAVLRALTGPLSPTEPAATPTEKGDTPAPMQVVVVNSTSSPGDLSLRMKVGDRTATPIFRALEAAGAKPGDRLELRFLPRE